MFGRGCRGSKKGRLEWIIVKIIKPFWLCLPTGRNEGIGRLDFPHFLIFLIPQWLTHLPADITDSKRHRYQGYALSID